MAFGALEGHLRPILGHVERAEARHSVEREEIVVFEKEKLPVYLGVSEQTANFIRFVPVLLKILLARTLLRARIRCINENTCLRLFVRQALTAFGLNSLSSLRQVF